MYKTKNKNMAYDSLQNVTMKEMRMSNIAYRPCLVQHIGDASMISPGIEIRDTMYYKGYLDELGIAYEECYTIENVERLKALQMRDREKREIPSSKEKIPKRVNGIPPFMQRRINKRNIPSE